VDVAPLLLTVEGATHRIDSSKFEAQCAAAWRMTRLRCASPSRRNSCWRWSQRTIW